MGLVRAVPDWIRRGGGNRGGALGADSHASASAVCDPDGNRSARRERGQRAMMAPRLLAVAALGAALLAGCDWLPGKPKPSERPISPSQVKSFARLYAENCAGCHGADGKFGAAYELADATYQSLVDDAT